MVTDRQQISYRRLAKPNAARRHAFACLTYVVTILTVAVMGFAALGEEAQTGKIVGLGAADCGEFLSETATQPLSQKDYLAWAQGYMSALLLTRPPGVDRGLDLMPKSLPLLKQLAFLRDYCVAHPQESFADAVEALYKRLRTEGSRANLNKEDHLNARRS